MHDLSSMKDKLVDEARRQLDKGLQGVDAQEMGAVIDMIKDLAVAEKACAETEYYEAVVDAMDDGYDERYGYRQPYYMGEGESNRAMSERMGYRNSQGQYARKPRRMRSGYTEESVENIRDIMRSADPARREQLRKDLEELMREM